MKSIQNWLSSFSSASAAGDGDAVSQLFSPDGMWRDYLAFDWTLRTLEGRSQILSFVTANGQGAGFRVPSPEVQTSGEEYSFRFRTDAGIGLGHIRLRDRLCTTLFTMLEDLAQASPDQNTPQAKAADRSVSPLEQVDPFVLIVGGGQSGLALGARLAEFGVPYLIVDKHPRVGDQWRFRYDSLVLHDPVWYDHMPYIPFPKDWPIFAPKDMMANWLEDYARRLSLSICTNTHLTGAEFDEAGGSWKVSLLREFRNVELRCRHLVMAVGISGLPKIPKFEGQDVFRGEQLHSSRFKSGREMHGQNVVVIGANNSAHDIAAELVEQGAKPVMVQRSSTLVVPQSVFCEKLLGPLYSPRALRAGISTEKADFLAASVPLRLLETTSRSLWNEIRREQRKYYQRLSASGFRLNFAEDGVGLGLKYRRTASGYYIDVGASEMVIDGRIGLRSGVRVDRLTDGSVKLNTGEALPADAIVYATGFGSMTDWIAELISPETAAKIGPCWGYGSGTKGDPGPWIGELRNMWMPTRQRGLWCTGGNLAQVRFYSRLLALQLRRKLIQED